MSTHKLIINLLLIWLILISSTYAANLNDGVVSYWNLNVDEAPKDYFGYNDFTTYTNVDFETSGCANGNCMYIDGTSTLNFVTGLTGFNINAWSISIWFNISSVAARQTVYAAEVDKKISIAISSASCAGKLGYALGNVASWYIDAGVGDCGSNDIPLGGWNHFVFIFNGSSYIGYLNGVEDFEYVTASLIVAPIGLRLGDWDAAGNFPSTFRVDEFSFYNDTLTSEQVIELYNLGEAMTFPYIGLTFEDPTPPDGSRNNTQVTINVSCEDGNVTLWWNGTNYNETKPIDQEASPAVWTTMVVVEETYQYWASCDVGVSNSSVRTWIYDVSSPLINLNSNSSFSQDNSSILYNKTLGFSYSLTDNDDLDSTEALIRYSNISGSIYFNYTNTTLSGLSFTYSNSSINMTTWPVGLYYVTIAASDSHNPLTIGYDVPLNSRLYDIDNREDKLVFGTREGNTIEMYCDDLIDIIPIRKKDKYEIETRFSRDIFGNRRNEKICYLESDQQIKYKQDSPYKGHFIIGNPLKREGNFIDWEQEGHVKVEEKRKLLGFGEKYYKITITNEADNIIFHSIGGLNFNNVTYTFSLSNLTTNLAMISPSNPFTTEDLIGSCQALETFSRNFSINYQWFNNDSIYSSGTYPSRNNSGINITVNTINSDNTTLGEKWILSCQANNRNYTTSWLNSSITTIINVSIDDCSTFTNNINYIDYRESATDTLINLDSVGYDLNFAYAQGSININDTKTNINNQSFCTNINATTNDIEFTITGSLFLENALYASKNFEVNTPWIASTGTPFNTSIYMILLNESSSIEITWLTTSYEPISGTLEVYECQGDGSRTLLESTTIINGLSVINIELINKLYSYEIIVNGITYTNSEGFTKCHVEPSIERQFLVDLEEVDITPIVGLYSIQCNLTKILNNTVNMSWGYNPENTDTLTGCMQAYRHTVTGTTLVYEECDTDGNILAVVPASGFDYSVSGRIYQSGYSIVCGEVIEFKNDNSPPNLLGLTGLMSIFFLFVGMVLLFSQDIKEQFLALIIALIIAFITGWLAFGWQTIISIITFLIIIYLIGRHSKKP